jgi:glycerol-3-phosphate acyltransferase PlsY
MIESNLQSADSLHWLRRIWHMASGVLILVAKSHFSLSETNTAILLALAGLVFLSIDILKTFFPKFKRAYVKVGGIIMRPKELDHINSSTWYLLGLAFTFALCPLPLATMITLFLAVGDPLAAIVGIQFGKKRLAGGKSWLGTTTCFAACFMAAWSVGYFYELGFSPEILFYLSAGIIGAVAEAIPTPIDDNFTIPVFSTLGLLGLLAVWPV